MAGHEVWINVRDAEEADLPALIAIKGEGSDVLHRDRLYEAQRRSLRYLVLEVDHIVVGMACLYNYEAGTWPDTVNPQYFPHIADLQIQEAYRGRGHGSAFVRAIGHIAAAAGHQHLYLSVEPLHNPRAYGLYQRLGFRALQAEPYHETWSFTDSAEIIHSGEHWIVDMVLPL